MNPESEDNLVRIAGAVADGDPVAWVVEESRHPELKAILARLQVLETLGRVHGADLPARPLDETALPHPTADETPNQWGPLRILAKLGEGGFGTVYRAYDPALQRDVALKLWRPERFGGDVDRDAYLREARRLARVRHPNILAVHGADEHDGFVGIWTDLLEGVTLEAALQQRGYFSAEEAALVGLDLCRALAAVHAAGLVHRDVKTTNVMREQGGRVVLLDFGATSETGPHAGASRDGPAWGTPITMSPEQLRGETAGPATDVYGLGVLLYRLVSGRYPFEANSLPELRALHADRDPVPLLDRRPELPPAFVSVVQRAIERDHRRRYQSVGTLFQALAESVGLGARVPPIEPRSASAPRLAWSRRRAWITGVAAAAALAVLFLYLRPETRRTVPSTDKLPSQAPAIARSETPATISSDAGAGSGQGVLTASAQLYLARGSGRTQLLPGSAVGVGDGLYLEFECPDPAYTYVLNEDSNGDVFVLFPIAGLSEQNPLAPGRLHRLPGLKDGSLMNWGVTTAGGGSEVIIVIASRTPQSDLERDIASFRRAGESPQPAYAQISPHTTSVLRGVGGLMESPEDPGPRAPVRLSAALRSLPKTPEGSRGLWTWQIQLRNTTPR